MVVLGKKIRTQHLEIGAEAIYLLRKEKEVPDVFALNLLHGISRGQFTSGVEAQDSSFVIEDDDQRLRLQSENVDVGQGFLFSVPHDAEAIDRFLEDYAIFSGKPL